MIKILALVVALASCLLAAPVIESGSTSTQLFQAIGTADGGGGE